MRRGEDPFGFRHDGETTTIPLENAVGPGRTTSLCVNVAQHAPAGRPSESALVEVEDESGPLFLLTPVECLRLARALLESAGVVVGEPGDPDHLDELRRLAADVRDSAGRLALAAGSARGKLRIEHLTGTEAGVTVSVQKKPPQSPRSTP